MKNLLAYKLLLIFAIGVLCFPVFTIAQMECSTPDNPQQNFTGTTGVCANLIFYW